MPVALRFRHQVLAPDPPCRPHDLTLIADVNGDGRPDIVGQPHDPARHRDVWWKEIGRRAGRARRPPRSDLRLPRAARRVR